jgi:putative hydrolase of the HAD superfamily
MPNLLKFNTAIFDLGGVIEKINPNAVKLAFEKLGMDDAESFFTIFRQSEICSEFELGKVTEKEFIDYIKSKCKIKTSSEQIKTAWSTNQCGITKSTVKTVNSLKNKGLKLFVLSNTNQIHYQKIVDAFFKKHKQHINSLFNGIYCSYEMHLRKPGKEVFEYLISEENIIPSNSIYIDDLEANLFAPKELGFHCICHQTNKEIITIPLIKTLIS